MLLNDFEKILIQQGWLSDKFHEKKKITSLPKIQKDKVNKLPDFLRDVITTYNALANKNDTAWFVTYSNLIDEDENSFNWNEFEKQSMEAVMSEEDSNSVSNFWEKHFCFFMSVKDGYSHLSIVTQGNNTGNIVFGSDPEYEEVDILCDSLDDFIDILCQHVTGLENNAVLERIL